MNVLHTGDYKQHLFTVINTISHRGREWLHTGL